MLASTYILPCMSNSQLFYSYFIIECIWSSRVPVNFTWADLVLIRKIYCSHSFELDSAILKMCLKQRSYEAPLLYQTIIVIQGSTEARWTSIQTLLLCWTKIKTLIQTYPSCVGLAFKFSRITFGTAEQSLYSAVVPNLFLTFSLYLHPSWIYPILMLSLPAPLNSST